jgi:hypothetical protein
MKCQNRRKAAVDVDGLEFVGALFNDLDGH